MELNSVTLRPLIRYLHDYQRPLLSALQVNNVANEFNDVLQQKIHNETEQGVFCDILYEINTSFVITK
jgi:hypothetical protein